MSVTHSFTNLQNCSSNIGFAYEKPDNQPRDFLAGSYMNWKITNFEIFSLTEKKGVNYSDYDHENDSDKDSKYSDELDIGRKIRKSTAGNIFLTRDFNDKI